MNTLFAEPLRKPENSYANRSPQPMKSKEEASFDMSGVYDYIEEESPVT